MTQLLIETDKDTMKWIGEYFEEIADTIFPGRKLYSQACAALERIEEYWIEIGEPYEFKLVWATGAKSRVI